MKFKFYFIITTVAVLLASCASNKYADITRVNPDNKITGKGTGYVIKEQPKQLNTQTQETEVLNENVVVADDHSHPTLMTENISISEQKTEVTPQETASIEETISTNSVQPQNLITPKLNTVDLKENPAISSFGESSLDQSTKIQTKKKGFFKKIFSPKVDILYVILAILIPPLAVGLLVGITNEFWLNLLLTILFYIPGLIHALYIVFRET